MRWNVRRLVLVSVATVATVTVALPATSHAGFPLEPKVPLPSIGTGTNPFPWIPTSINPFPWIPTDNGAD